MKDAGNIIELDITFAALAKNMENQLAIAWGMQPKRFAKHIKENGEDCLRLEGLPQRALAFRESRLAALRERRSQVPICSVA